MGDFASLSKLTVGSNSFDLVNWKKQVTPIVAKDAFAIRIGSEVKLSGECMIEAANAAALVAAIIAADTALRVVAANVSIYELNTKVAEITAASCIDAGPHISYTWIEQTAALERRFQFDISGRTTATGSAGNESTSSASRSVSPLGLIQESKSGTVVGGTASAEYDTTLAAWVTAHPYPNWIVRTEAKSAQSGGAVEYTLAASQVADPLPSVIGAPGASAVEGTRTETIDTDATSTRQTRTISYDLVVNGDMDALATALIPTLTTGQQIVRETLVYGTIRERRLQCTWQILSGIGGSALLDWNQEWSIIGEHWTEGELTVGHQNLRTVSYPGANPVVVLDSKPEYRYRQSGRAVGCGAYIKAPHPAYAANLAKPVEITLRRINEFERETTWSYEFVSTTPLTIAATDLDRPTTPTAWTTGGVL